MYYGLEQFTEIFKVADRLVSLTVSGVSETAACKGESQT
mgnify:CR=1 FL=1